MKIQIDSIQPHPENSKIYDNRDISHLREEIENTGVIAPIVINQDHWILSGHRRVEVAKLLGYTELDYTVKETEDYEHSVEILIALNNQREKTIEEKTRETTRLAQSKERRKGNQYVSGTVPAGTEAKTPTLQAVDEIGVSRNTYYRAKPVVEKIDEYRASGDEETAQALSNALNTGGVNTIYEVIKDPVKLQVFEQAIKDPVQPLPPREAIEIARKPQQPSTPFHAHNKPDKEHMHERVMYNMRHFAGMFDHFTIGYSGGRSAQQVIDLLKASGVNVLVDVRHNAFSQYKQDFNKSALESLCNDNDIEYIHIQELGISSDDRSDLHHTHDYESLFNDYEQRLTLQGMIDVLNEYQVDLSQDRCAFMCTEIDPCTCHRNRIAKAITELLDLKVYDL